MDQKEKQKQIQEALGSNQITASELLATAHRPRPLAPLAIMLGSVISAIGLGLIRRGTSPASQHEKAPLDGQGDPERLPVWLRRKRSQR